MLVVDKTDLEYSIFIVRSIWFLSTYLKLGKIEYETIFCKSLSTIRRLWMLFQFNSLPDSTLVSLYDTLHHLRIKNDGEADNITAKRALDE